MTVVDFQGIPDSNEVHFVHNDGTLFQNVKVELEGNSTLLDGINSKSVKVVPYYIGGEGHTVTLEVKQPYLLVNSINNPYTHLKSLAYLDQIVKKLDTKVINAPKNILKLSKEKLYEHFKHHTSIALPKTVKCQPKRIIDVQKCILENEISLPCLLEHALSIKQLKIESLDSLSSLEQFAFDGSDYFLIEEVSLSLEYSTYLIVNGKVISENDNFDKKSQIIINELFKYLKLDIFEVTIYTDINKNIHKIEACIPKNLHISNTTIDLLHFFCK